MDVSSQNNIPTRANQASGPLAVAQDGNERRYSAVSPLTSPALEAIHDSGSSFCVSPIEESNSFHRQEQKASAMGYFADAQLNALYVDTPPSPPAVLPMPRKKKIVAFAAESEQIPTVLEDFSPASEAPVLMQPTHGIDTGAPNYRDFESHKATSEDPALEKPATFYQPVSQQSASDRLFTPQPISKKPALREQDRQQTSGAQSTPWDLYSGEPTTPIAGKAGQVNSPATFHKSSGSASNILSWGREQLQPIKEFAQSRSRNSSFHKSQIPVPTKANDSKLKNGSPRSGSRVSSMEVHPRRPSASNSGVQLSHIGLVPTTVTTITAGGPKALPQRPAPRDAYKQWREQRDANPLPEINTVADTTLSKQLDSLFGGTTVSNPGSPSPDESLNNSSRDSLRDSPQESPKYIPSGQPNFVEDSPSIMSRRRPIPNAMLVSRKPVRKPAPTEAIQESDPVAQPHVDQSSKPMDRILALEAKRDGLARRRINLETVIKELTRVIQPDNGVYDLAAKQEVKRSVQSIENDIAEIKREEHELGLKAARSWRRLDENGHGDGSTLWVKRITS
ncbi:hypothetical protein N7520_007928 [Penicillium odoratum]|uniref:uncharacterized protein n=1 Tax=Penicillium odoratum TaxID=1167516 RepID=UPI0025479B8B|nr:uncharacterized protein N7520_007928 [Penicillium odoratum]KAJ5760772.1 hypothetical protein N7520_007928 [Penicillium odoratum]